MDSDFLRLRKMYDESKCLRCSGKCNRVKWQLDAQKVPISLDFASGIPNNIFNRFYQIVFVEQKYRISNSISCRICGCRILFGIPFKQTNGSDKFCIFFFHFDWRSFSVAGSYADNLWEQFNLCLRKCLWFAFYYIENRNSLDQFCYWNYFINCLFVSVPKVCMIIMHYYYLSPLLFNRNAQM